MSTIAFDQFALTRIADFARMLSRLHQASRRRPVDDDQIDREFNAVCMSIWGYTTDDFSDELFSDVSFAALVGQAHADVVLAEGVGLRPDIPPRLFRELLLKATDVVQQRLIASADAATQAEIRRVLAKVSGEVGSKSRARDYTAAMAATVTSTRVPSGKVVPGSSTITPFRTMPL